MPVSNAFPPRRNPTGFGRLAMGFVLLALALILAGCRVEIHQGLTEEQANSMLAALLKRDIDAQKVSAGKKGFSISVDEQQIVQALEILKENNLPRREFTNLGEVFSGQGMISSPSEEQVRLAYAISQELADTFSRIDGVLTSRVHVVPAGAEQSTDKSTLPSAAVFLRHLPDSPVVDLVARVREVTAKAVPNLIPDRVSVMLVPVREAVSVPMAPQEHFLGIPYMPADGPPYVLVGAILTVALTCAGAILLAAHEFLRRRGRKTQEAAPPEDQQP